MSSLGNVWAANRIQHICNNANHKTPIYGLFRISVLTNDGKYTIFEFNNQYKNGIDIAFADNTLLFLSCAEAEKNLHTTPNSQRLIDNLAIDNPLMYAALALDCELQAWADAMDTNWNPY